MPSDSEIQGGAGPVEAQVKWYNARKGFGFVLGPDGQDVFFHASALTEAGIEPPETGDTLVCEIGTDRQGRRLVTRITERKLGDGGGGCGRPASPSATGRRVAASAIARRGGTSVAAASATGRRGATSAARRAPASAIGRRAGTSVAAASATGRRGATSAARRAPASARRAPPSATGRRRGASSAATATRAGRPMPSTAR